MKKFMLAGVIALIGFAFTITSCNKYVDGPKMTLLTKKQRITGDWKISKYTVDGTDYTSTLQSLFGNDFVWSIEKDNSYKESGNVDQNGTWAFGEDKDDITFTQSSSSSSSNTTTYKILELKNKEIELQYTESNGSVEVLTMIQ